MMKKRFGIFLFGIVLAASLLCACGGRAQQSSGEHAETAGDESSSASEADAGAETESGNTDDSAAEEMTFVDVHGESYTMEIDPAVEANTLDADGFVRDGDRLSYEDSVYTSRMGVDVSYYQGDIDWERVRAAGYEFVFVRIGFRGYGEDGSLNRDDSFYKYVRGAQKAGLDVGAYFFSQAVNEEEAVEEAEFVLKILEKKDIQLQLPVVFDPENISDDEARTDDVSGEQFTENTLAFCRAIEEAGYEAAFYCNMKWEAFTLDLSRLSDYPVWYADYEKLPQTPYAFTWWQYSESASVDGIDGTCDVDLEMIEQQ